MTTFDVEMRHVDENITVEEFEDIHNTLVRVIYKNDSMVFPSPDLNIKDSIILFNQYGLDEMLY